MGGGGLEDSEAGGGTKARRALYIKTKPPRFRAWTKVICGTARSIPASQCFRLCAKPVAQNSELQETKWHLAQASFPDNKGSAKEIFLQPVGFSTQICGAACTLRGIASEA